MPADLIPHPHQNHEQLPTAAPHAIESPEHSLTPQTYGELPLLPTPPGER